MAKKKEEAVKQDVKMNQEETAAFDVVKSVSKGEKVKEKYKLANPSTQYCEGDFYLSGDQEKELPESPSTELIARIRSGFIVKA